MSRTHLGRRSVLKGLGAAAASGLVVGTASGHEGAHPLDSQLAEVRSATAKYNDVHRALADGFVPLGPAVCGMSWHFMNPGRMKTVLDGFEEPNLLVYGVEGDGSLKLGGVEYGIPEAVWYDEFGNSSPPDLFNDESSPRADEAWYPHHARYHVFARPVDEQSGKPGLDAVLDTTNWAEVGRESLTFGSEGVPVNGDREPAERVVSATADFDQDGATETRPAEQVALHPDLLTLHAWVHVANPEGVFHPFNPNELFHPEHCTPVHPH